ncbi:MAG: flagellar biosynthesis protein FlhA [Caldibacillus sp.]
MSVKDLSKDLTVLVGVIMIIIMLVLPLSPTLIDILLVINISLSLLILLTTMNIHHALEFSIFPSLLLLMTLFRLGLNVSTTRSILSRGEAGGVISTFGSFVVGGDILVGLVIFFILVIINFVVITRGAERVAEVSARFTLDAMPGKQMSIDADLNAGLISEQEARRRREEVSREADFYGAMDGASKFVKGDAIAGILTVFINLIFGIIIGMLTDGLSFAESVDKYARLTVGDGLVTQIPALLMSTSMAVIVTRAASTENLSRDVLSQIMAYPKMLYVTGVTIFLLGLFTPIPDLVTIPISGLLIYGGYKISAQKTPVVTDEDVVEEEQMEEEMKKPENVLSLLDIDPIEFEFGYALIPLADTNQGGDLLDRVVMIRRQLAIETGLVIPTVRIRDNIQLEPNEYRIKIKGDEVARGHVFLDHYLAMSPGMDDPRVIGIDTVEPAFGIPAKWITEEIKPIAEDAGYTVVDPPTVISTHLTEVLKAHAADILGRQETKQLIDHLKESYPILVEEVTPNPLSVGDIQKVLANLLRERVSIRNLPTIFETLADFCKITTDTDILTEYVRQALSKQITKQYKTDEGPLKVITLSAEVEQAIQSSVKQTEYGNYLALEPEKSEKIIQNMAHQFEQLSARGENPIILCSPAIRMYVRSLIERYFPQVPVLSYNELEPTVEVQSVGMVTMS